MRLLMVSTSTVHGQPYLAYLHDAIRAHFGAARRILFVPYARPGGIDHNGYTARANEVFQSLGYHMRGAHEFQSAADAAAWAEGVFTGGGNSFVLLQQLYQTGLLESIDAKVRDGMPYMGTSAGCNITGLSIGTTNDMPIVLPPSLQAFGWVPFNYNPHYLDPDPGSTHMGETRETRIAEFHHFNGQPVLGLREGSWVNLTEDAYTLHGDLTARLFRKGMPAEELPPGRIDPATW